MSPAAATGDLEALVALNHDYIDSVQRGDVPRFDEILADDFVCSNPDGSLVDRACFLEQTARPVTIANLTAHDVDVRLLGDVAIIHARTSYTLADGREGAGRYTDVGCARSESASAGSDRAKTPEGSCFAAASPRNRQRL